MQDSEEPLASVIPSYYNSHFVKQACWLSWKTSDHDHHQGLEPIDHVSYWWILIADQLGFRS